ncbi:hypothetical protein CC78DRAFT_581460 [Lojkania enalia]|uniref:Uncharacterized protein n=1 Tax=Lojkania enalia TaxID=147567 RepID=A0A9P4KC55_9PLEO|nr:hypothetical protein CC78DRAFT_581460 [Didymosphaeria enalia]
MPPTTQVRSMPLFAPSLAALLDEPTLLLCGARQLHTYIYRDVRLPTAAQVLQLCKGSGYETTQCARTPLSQLQAPSSKLQPLGQIAGAQVKKTSHLYPACVAIRPKWRSALFAALAASPAEGDLAHRAYQETPEQTAFADDAILTSQAIPTCFSPFVVALEMAASFSARPSRTTLTV